MLWYDIVCYDILNYIYRYIFRYILCVRAQTRCSDPNVRVRCHTRMDYIWLDTIRCGIGTPWGADLWFGGLTKNPATMNASTHLTGLRHIPPGKMASHSHVVVYHGPLLSHLLGVAPSTFTTVYPFEVNQTQTFLSEIILLATATRKQGHRLFSVYFNLRPRNLPWHRISTCDRLVHMLKEVQAASDKQKKKVCSCLPQERWIPPTIQRLVLQCFWWWCQGMHLQATQLQTSW